ncbi:flagellar biosynthesis protein FliQ [Sporomusa malonica]|uniref:Flagellar biosynthetic protein FliQ n=1 Tax=Sporomusa malonica TaxID=112901 RepID=A0A1W2AZA8_9FIRM|nr:flagellar biosynthesis protein FliQ [Sporomusa malonica]SMC65812.1 flagellar biosynthetic protein FliQ [Sporomusa malonica]
MSGDMAIQIGRDALAMVMLVSAPMLGLGLIVGILVSVFQATTQIQEQSLAFIPKIIAVFVAILVFGPWMLSLIVDYTRELFLSLPNMIH